MKDFEQWRGTLPATKLMQTGNCCRMSYEAGQESRQAEIDDLKAQLAKVQAIPEGFTVVPVGLLDFARFMCKKWTDIDEYVWNNCTNIEKYPMIKGENFQRDLVKIGSQEINTWSIHSAVKWMIKNWKAN